MAEALARVQLSGSARQLDPWQEELDRLTRYEHARPASRLIRVAEGVRCYEGWRASEIAEVLDACCAVDGEWWIGKTRMVDKRGNVYQGHGQKNGAHMLWRQNNVGAARANNRLQAAKFRERARREWNDYCAAYREKFLASEPVGFDRWCRVHRAAWMQNGAAGMVLNQPRGIAVDIRESIEEAQAA